jgi:hypothetical protein
MKSRIILAVFLATASVFGQRLGSGPDSTWVSGEITTLKTDHLQEKTTSHGIVADQKFTASDTSAAKAFRSNLYVPQGSSDMTVGKSGQDIHSVADSTEVNGALFVGKTATTDNSVPSITLRGDADSDASSVTPESIGLTLVGAATPTNAYWSFTSTQGLAFTFNKRIQSSSTTINGGFWTANGLAKMQEVGGDGVVRFYEAGSDTGVIGLNATTMYYKSNNNHVFTVGTGSGNMFITATQLYPGSSDAYSLGTATRLWKYLYGSDVLYWGGKGQTAKMIIGGQNTITEEADSTIVIDGSNGALTVRDYYTPASVSNNHRRFYSGADTLVLFNGSKTGRDSAAWVMPTGTIAVSVTGSAPGVSVDGNKTAGNLLQLTNENDGAIGDSSFVVQSQGGVLRSTKAGITAVTPGAQGDGPLTADINEISVCGTGSDAVTMPEAQAGREIFIINNGAQTLEIWPATGDNLGAGANTAVTLAAGSNVTYVAYDGANWEAK